MSDLISRQDALEIIDKLMEIHFDRKVVLAKVYDQIKDMPSADRPTGDDLISREEWHSDFCPNCGAKMTKGGDNNESIPDWQKEIEEEYEWLHWDIR